MGWENRSGRSYYYRKVRRGRRVFSVYEGGDVAGIIAETRAEASRESRRREVFSLREQTVRDDEIDAMIDESWRAVSAAVEAELESAGFHSHKGQWRLKRGA